MADAAPALAIIGATATGKTVLSVRLAESLGGEIVCMDSRQVYRGMDIGTAKPEREIMTRVPHHGFDLVDPDERYSAGRFERDARRWIQEIHERGRVPMLVGGTGFFLRALTDPLFREPPLPDAPRREALRAWLRARPPAELERWLRRLDPSAYERPSRAPDSQRSLRALEVALLSGRPLSWWQRHAPSRQEPMRPLIFILELRRAELYRRIDARVHRMLDTGFVEEVRRLLERGYGPGDPGFSATGYREIAAHLRTALPLGDVVTTIQRQTRRYARRQLTWLRHQLPADAVHLDADEPADRLEDRVVRAWRKEHVH
jgi:tRNA dimethylallyltransferase